MNDAPGNQGAAPVADKDEQEQRADERQPIAVDLFTNLVASEITQVIPQKLEQVLHATGITLHLASTQDHHGEQGADDDPGAQEDLTVDVEVANLPIKVFANLEFSKGEV